MFKVVFFASLRSADKRPDFVAKDRRAGMDFIVG